MKLVSIAKYDIKFKEWDMNRIKDVENTYSEILRDIHLQIPKLLSNISEKPHIEQFNNIEFQTIS